jgi:hypothetical protein
VLEEEKHWVCHQQGTREFFAADGHGCPDAALPIEGRRWLPKVGEIRRRLIDSRWDQVIGFCTVDTVRKVLTHLSLIG